MNQHFDVCVRGAGLVGQTLALLLARANLRVALVAPASANTPVLQTPQEHASDIRAYAINAASRETLLALRTWPEAAAQAVSGMRVYGDEGGQLQFDALTQGVNALAWIAPAAALTQLAEQAIRFQPLITCLSDEQSQGLQAPLTAVCEGKASATRAAYGVAFDVQPYAMSAVAARLTCERPHQGVALQWFKGGEVLALLPLAPGHSNTMEAGTEPGQNGNSVALVWSVSTERAAALNALSTDDFETQLQTACGDAWGSMRLSGARAAWPLALSRAQRLVGPGFALAGDAAHTVHPLAGQGLNLGLADAAELARVLGEREYWRSLGDEKLLRRYERARAAAVSNMGTLTHGLHSLFAMPGARVQSLRNWGLSGFDRSGPLKNWALRQAMGLAQR